MTCPDCNGATQTGYICPTCKGAQVVEGRQMKKYSFSIQLEIESEDDREMDETEVRRRIQGEFSLPYTRKNLDFEPTARAIVKKNR